MTKQKCANCKYYFCTTNNEDETILQDSECRRYAPRRIHGVGTGESHQYFPYVYPFDWCGEFESAESESEQWT
jgi:hypothetical protein